MTDTVEVPVLEQSADAVAQAEYNKAHGGYVEVTDEQGNKFLMTAAAAESYNAAAAPAQETRPPQLTEET